MAHETRVRELSPWSARRALTEKMNQEQSGLLPDAPARHNNDPPWKRDVSQRQNRKMSPPGQSRESERDSPVVGKAREPDSPRDHRSKDSFAKATSVVPLRDSSPEPYRKARDSQRKRDRSRARHSESRRDRRDRSRDGSKDGRKDDRRDRSRDRHRRDRSRDRRRDRSRDSGRRERDRRRHRSRSPRSPPPKRRRHTRSPSASRSRSPHRRSKAALPPQEISFRGTDNAALPPSKYGGAPAAMEKPNFKTTGLLAKAANKVEGTKISLKYHEPAEARKPSSKDQWKIVVFKGDDVVDTIELHTKSCWLFGRSVEVVDYVLEHPSSSGQHAVIQFRYIQKTVEDEFGVKKQTGKVKPYVIDLESSNGTELNGERIETSRYMELRHKDTLMFAGSEREYVVILPPPENKGEA